MKKWGCLFIAIALSFSLFSPYTAIAATTEKSQVITTYQTKDKKVLKEVTTEGEPGADYQTEALVFEGYNLVSSPDQPAGKFPQAGEKTYLYYTYEAKQTAPVTISYLDTQGKTLAAKQTLTGEWGKTYQTKPKTIANYTLSKTTGAVNGTFSDKKADIVYTYQVNKAAPITVLFVDTAGKTIATKQTLQGAIGNSYQTKPKTIKNYTLAKTAGKTKGTFSSQAETVTYTYKKVEPPKADPILSQSKVNFDKKVNSTTEKIYSKPYQVAGVKQVGTAKTYNKKTVHILQSAKTKHGTYYQFRYKNKTIGWMKTSAFTSPYDKLSYDKKVSFEKRVATKKTAIYNKPYKIKNAKKTGVSKTYNNLIVQVVREAKTEHAVFYQFKVNGKVKGWMKKSAFKSPKLLLSVPIIKQRPELPTGCEITSVTMMLRYTKAKKVTKTKLANEMPRHSSNPNKGFVGNPYTTHGWTIYPKALKKLVKKYAGSSRDLTGSSTKTLERFLRYKKPVVVWVKMHGFSVHALTLTGYDKNNFYYNDCWTGQKNVKISKKALDNTWKTQKRRAISY